MTTIDMSDVHAREYHQVVTLKAHLKLCSAGMNPPRGLTKSALMKYARKLTGASFGLRDYPAAISALEARRDALLVHTRNTTHGVDG